MTSSDCYDFGKYRKKLVLSELLSVSDTNGFFNFIYLFIYTIQQVYTQLQIKKSSTNKYFITQK